MFIADQLIYLQLQKTGCTHIARLLTEYCGGENTNKHGRLDRDPGGRLVLASVRNPWDWYVSLWAYGCLGRGAIRSRLTLDRRALAAHSIRTSVRHPARWLALPGQIRRQAMKIDPPFWRRVYADSSDRGAFREWLIAIHERDVQNAVFEDPQPSPLHTAVGLFSARLIYILTDPAAFDRQHVHLRTLADARAFLERNMVVDRMIRTEHIAEDLAGILNGLGIGDVTPDILAGHGKTNSSKRDPFESYYDRASARLVADRDALVIERYGYHMPDLGGRA